MMRILIFTIRTNEEVTFRLFTVFLLEPFTGRFLVFEQPNHIDSHPFVTGAAANIAGERRFRCHVVEPYFDLRDSGIIELLK